MALTATEENAFWDVYQMTYPTSWRIIEALKDNRLSVDDLIKVIGEDKNLVEYYLLGLGEHNLVKSKLQIVKYPTENEKGIANKVYSLTERAYNSFQIVKQLL